MKSKGLYWDIETSPMLCYTWDRYPQDGVIDVVEPTQILTVAWQWEGEKTIHCKGQDDFDDYIPGVNNDLELCKLIWELLNQCDYAVAHNGDRFDVQVANYRMMIHGLQPPTPFVQVDTKKMFKRVARFPSNRLKDLAHDLNVAQKGDPGGFGTWKGVMRGDPKSWRHMKRYNKHDIPPLRDIYMKVRAWDRARVPLNVMEDIPQACPVCMGKDLRPGMKYKPTNSSLYQYYRCLDCGHSTKARVPEKTDKPKYVT